MGVAAWIGVLCALSAAASAGQADDVKSAQPKAAEFAGVRALQQAHPDLTGAGVKLALISRSITRSISEKFGAVSRQYLTHSLHSSRRNFSTSLCIWWAVKKYIANISAVPDTARTPVYQSSSFWRMVTLFLSGFHDVPDTAHRVEQFFLERTVHLHAKMIDEHVHNVG